MRIGFIAGLFLLISCAPSYVMLVHLRTGERITCTQPAAYGGHPIAYMIAENRIKDCVQQHEAAGYVRADRLTEEQRASLTPRATSIQQDIIIRGPSER